MLRSGAALVFAASLTFAAPLVAQERPIAASAEAEIRLAIRTAERLSAGNPDRAKNELLRVQTLLQNDRVLTAARREQLQRQVADRLRVLDAPAPAVETPTAPLPREAQQKSAEFEQFQRDLRDADAMRKAGQVEQANRQLAALSQRFSESFVVKADAGLQQASARVSQSAQVRNDKERGFMNELGGVDRAGIMPRSDMEFPADFKERTAKRKSDTAPTAEELRVLRALEAPVSARFDNSPLETAMDHLSTLINLPIVLDKGALDELRIASDTPVNFAVKKPVSARAALRSILRNVGLTYVVSDGVVFATTPERARAYLVTKVYSVGDLTVPIDLFDPFGEMFNVAALIDAIVSSIDPESWEQRGGPGVIRYYPPTKAIIVRQSAEIQTMVKRSLVR